MSKVAFKERAEKENDLYRDKPRFPNKQLKMSLPLPVSVNNLHYNSANGGKRLTQIAQNYTRDSRALINQFIEEQRWTRQSKNTWMYVDLVFFMPDRRIRDSHNMLKLLMDVMQGTVYDNDYNIMPRIQSVEYDAENPRVEVLITMQTKNNRDKGLKTANV